MSGLRGDKETNVQVHHRRKKGKKGAREEGKRERKEMDRKEKVREKEREREGRKEREEVREGEKERISRGRRRKLTCNEHLQYTRHGARPFQAYQTLQQCCKGSVSLTFTNKTMGLRELK